MKLSPEDAALFYRLTWELQFYVNRRRRIIPAVNTSAEYERLSMDQKLKVRNALYDHATLIDDFVAENPAGLSPGDLAIVRNWKRFVRGDFFIERFLKKGAYFIAADQKPIVYTVAGINDSIEDMLGPYLALPIYVKTVLLPFKGQIVYDGLLEPLSVFFGGGIRAELRETYLTAKQNGRIVESLDEEGTARPTPRQIVEKDWRSEVDALVATTDKLKGSRETLESEVFSLLKAAAHYAQSAVHNPDDLDALWQAQKQTVRALRKLEARLNRAEH